MFDVRVDAERGYLRDKAGMVLAANRHKQCLAITPKPFRVCAGSSDTG